MGYYCSVCKETISQNDYDLSTANIGAALCLNHQKVVTLQAVKLSKALKNLHIEHVLEYFDGFKHVDLAFLNAKIYVELDGSQHAFNPQQACIDDDRDQYSLRDGFITKRYPNSYIDSDVDSLALSIAFIANKRRSEFLDNKERRVNENLILPKETTIINNASSEITNNKKSIWKILKDSVYTISEKLENFE